MSSYTNAGTDVNSVKTLCGIDSVTGAVRPILIDPVTGAVICLFSSVSSLSPTLSPGWAQKDVNGASTLLALGSSGGFIVPVVDHSTNCLFVET